MTTVAPLLRLCPTSLRRISCSALPSAPEDFSLGLNTSIEALEMHSDMGTMGFRASSPKRVERTTLPAFGR